MNFSEKVEKLFRDHRGSQREIAMSLGVASSTFTSTIKRGSDKMKMSHIAAIADYFGVTVDYLLRDDIDDLYFRQGMPATAEEAESLLREIFKSSTVSKEERERVAKLAMSLWLSDSPVIK